MTTARPLLNVRSAKNSKQLDHNHILLAIKTRRRLQFRLRGHISVDNNTVRINNKINADFNCSVDTVNIASFIYLKLTNAVLRPLTGATSLNYAKQFILAFCNLHRRHVVVGKMEKNYEHLSKLCG